ncbi:ABC transporter permease, partial [Pseudomonas sp. BGM005]|nr:ABC transporter permease [Pseudomonas sp. BG5]
MEIKAPIDSSPSKPLAGFALRLPRNVGGPLIGLALLVLVFSFTSEYFFSLR